MKTRIASLAIGMAVGVGVMLTLGAGLSPKSSSDGWDRLKFIAYPNGVTGIFNPESGKLYLYTSNLESCYAVHQLEALGNPMPKTNR